MVRLTTDEIAAAPGGMNALSMRRMVAREFLKQHDLVITRWGHDYDSLDTSEPKLGLVYLRGDSEIVPHMEIWALVGLNAFGSDGSK